MRSSLLLWLAVTAAGQNGGPRIEVASVKVHTPRPGVSSWSAGPARIHISGNRVWVEDSDLTGLILAAYDAQSDQFSADKISDHSRYDVEMRSADPVGEEQARALLQSLLADRFKLRIGREAQMRPVYKLVVAKGGARLKQSAVGTRPAITTTPGAEVIRSRFTNQSTSDLAGFLRLVTPDRRPVMDATGLTGLYDFTLEFARDGGDSAGTSIFTAVQEQLGLRLEPETAPMEFFTVEHVEKPSAN